MDVNAVLARMRAASQALSLADSDERMAELAVEFGDAFESLDEWLSKGGFLPDNWNYGARNALQTRREV